jgi:hypothetical protein
MHDIVGQRSVENGRGVELLPRDCSPDNGEDARANDRTYAERCERPWTKGLFQPMFRLLRLGDQFVNGLAREELVRQRNAPKDARMDASGLKQKLEAKGKFMRPGLGWAGPALRSFLLPLAMPPGV